MVKLGKEVKYKITGFKGIVTGHAEYLTGCDQYLVQPECQSNVESYPESHWFDEGRLNIIGDKLTKDDVKGCENGCDYNNAPKK